MSKHVIEQSYAIKKALKEKHGIYIDYSYGIHEYRRLVKRGYPFSILILEDVFFIEGPGVFEYSSTDLKKFAKRFSELLKKWDEDNVKYII